MIEVKNTSLRYLALSCLIPIFGVVNYQNLHNGLFYNTDRIHDADSTTRR